MEPSGSDLPAALAERARAWLAAGRPPGGRPRDAATVVLLRDGDPDRDPDREPDREPGRDPEPDAASAPGVQAYLLRRVTGMAFAAGMHVFPGGVVDPRDADGAVPWAGPDPAAWGPALRADPVLTRAIGCAAVRETFEESGVLLAGPSAEEVVADTTGPAWEDDRRALLERTLAFSDLLDRRGLVLRADLLRPWAHWITPEFEQRRYDTRFLVAALPAGQRTRDVGGEADRVAWLRPADAVAAGAAGELAMLPPTVAVLRDLTPYATVRDVLAAAEGRVVRPVLPRPVLSGGRARLLVPGEPGFEEAG